MNISDLSALLRRDADTLARQLLPHGSYEDNGREWKARGRNSPTGCAISVHVAPDSKQGVCGFWNGAKRGGDMLDLVAEVHGLTLAEAKQWAERWLNLGEAPTLRGKDVRSHDTKHLQRRDSRDFERDRQQRQGRALDIWRSTEPLNGPGISYLRSRGLDPSSCDDEVRFHPGLRHPAGGTFPALVARVLDIRGEFLGIWRTYLKFDGSGKAPVENPKLGLGNVSGGAVRIGGIWPEIGIAEGLENSLACRQLLDRAIPVWSTLSTSGMRSVKLPPEIRIVRIFADGDLVKFSNGRVIPPAGEGAAVALKERLIEEGREATIEFPPICKDWDVVLREQNENAVDSSACQGRAHVP